MAQELLRDSSVDDVTIKMRASGELYATGIESGGTYTSPTISGTVAGGASYTSVTLTSPTISGTITSSAAQNASGVYTGTITNATTNTSVRSIIGQITASATGMSAGHASVGVRGLTTITGTTTGNAYFYGTQGKLVLSTGTVNTGSQVWATALLGQLDVSAATTYTENVGAISALWADCGATAHANAKTAAPTFFDVVSVTNSISGFKPHSMFRVQGDATNAFAFTAWDTTSAAVDWIVSGGDATVASASALKVLVGSDVRYIRLHAAP